MNFNFPYLSEFRFWCAFLLTLIYIILSIIYYDNCRQSTVSSQQAAGNRQQAIVGSQKSEVRNELLAEEGKLKTGYKLSDIEQNKINQKLPEIINPPPAIDAADDEVFTVVEQNPTFQGGDAARMNFLRKNIKYPAEAIKKQTEGKVIINFIIEKDGTVSNVNVLKGIGGGCDAEAVRVAKLMPKWNPGKQRGKAVRVLFNMPINFQLKMK